MKQKNTNSLAKFTIRNLVLMILINVFFVFNSYAYEYGVVSGSNRITMPITLGGFMFHPTLPFAYAFGRQTNTVTAFKVNVNDGSLTQISSSINSGGISPTFGASFDPNGQYLYVPNADSNSVAQFAIDSKTGNLSLVDNVIFSTVAPNNIYPYTISFSPTGKYAYVPMYKSNQIAILDVDKNSGKLKYRKSIPTGYAPVSFIFNHDGKYGVLNNQNSNQIQLFAVADNGELLLIENFTSPDIINPFFAAPNPDGVHFYVASNSNNRLVQIKLSMTPAPHLEYINSVNVGGIGPNTFLAFSNDLKYAYEGNYDDNSLSMFKVVDGVLQPLSPLTIKLTGYGVIQCRKIPNANFIYTVNFISNDLSVYEITTTGQLIPHVFKNSSN